MNSNLKPNHGMSSSGKNTADARIHLDGV
jgi:hypothetical protein